MSEKNIVLYGAGEQNCGSVLRFCRLHGCGVIFIVDKKSGSGNYFHNVPIYTPSYLAEYDSSATTTYYLVITARNPDVINEIKQDISSLGLSKAIVCDILEFASNFDHAPVDISVINCFVAYQCNLNCARCCALSPLVPADYPYPEVADFERDMERLSFLLGKELKEFHLEGGEPLLNPLLHEFIKVVRRNFPDTEILIITNGLTVKSQREAFWNVVHECGAIIELTPYPINLNYHQIYDYIQNKKISVHWSGNPGENRKFFKFVDFNVHAERERERERERDASSGYAP